MAYVTQKNLPFYEKGTNNSLELADRKKTIM